MTETNPGMDWLKGQIELFQSERARYEDYTRYLRAVLKKAADRLFPGSLVEARAKAPDSFAEKCLRKAGKYRQPVFQLTDLCGARVVAFSQAQVDAMCGFIKDHFEVDWSNSEDKLDILARNEFGYRSVHFVVQIRSGEEYGFALTAEERAWETGINAPGPAGKPFRRKAEIQVRTHLQHVWSDVFHDRLYKGGLKVPARYERATYAISAQMEPIDEKIVDLMARIDAYREEGGASLDRESTLREIEIVETLMAQPQGGTHGLARRAARLYRTLSRWDKAVAALRPFLGGEDPEAESIRVEYAAALCHLHADRAASPEFREGLALLRVAAAKPLDKILMPREERIELQARTLASLGWALEQVPDSSAEERRHCFREAYRIAPANPHHFRRFVEAEVKHRRQAGFLPEMAPLLDAAIATCKEQIQVGVSIPQAHFSQAVLQMLSAPSNAGPGTGSGAFPNRAGEGLYALARMAAQDPGKYTGGALDSLWNLRQALREGSGAEASPWSLELLEDGMALLIASAWSAAVAEGADPASVLCGGASLPAWLERIGKPWDKPVLGITPDISVVWIAGSADSLPEEKSREYARHLTEALAGFQGLVLGGGTVSGVPGALGEANLALQSGGGKGFRLLGILPEILPGNARHDRRYDSLHALRGANGFSFREIAHTWITLLRAGVRPQQVRLLGLGGGPIAGFEYRMALALGGTVGLLEGSGGAADVMRKEPQWWPDRREGTGNGAVVLKRLICLTEDPAVIRAFLQAEVVQENPANDGFAKLIHSRYVEKRRDRDSRIPPGETWKDLGRDFRLSNFHQAGYAASILKRAGYVLVPMPVPNPLLSVLPEAMVEAMSKLEHGRWIVERLQQGWVYGSKRDNAAKVHPDLVPWERLTEDSKERDREAVREFPALMMAAGFSLKAPGNAA